MVATNKKEQVATKPKTFAYYPAEDRPSRLKSSKGKKTSTTLRSSITPGTVVILLAGRFAGKRVVFLKQLPSGLLLVTGPFKVNGVPLRRVNQAYVIATSTKVDISSVKVPESVNDAFFTAKEEKHSKSAEGFATQDAKKKNELPADKKTAQKSVDDAVTAAVSKVPQLKEYLGAQFSLSKGVYPHELKF